MKVTLSFFVIANLIFGDIGLQAQETKTLNSSFFQIKYPSSFKFKKSKYSYNENFIFFSKKKTTKDFRLSIRSITYQKDNIKNFPIEFGEESDWDSIKYQGEISRLDSLKTKALSEGGSLEPIEPIGKPENFWKALNKIKGTDSNGDFIQTELFILLDEKEEKQFVKVYEIGNTRYWLEFRGPKEVYDENIEMVKTMFSTFLLKI